MMLGFSLLDDGGIIKYPNKIIILKNIVANRLYMKDILNRILSEAPERKVEPIA